MDHYAKEELVVDQFLMGMDSHEVNVQVAAHVHGRVDDVLRAARFLEAVQEEEKQYFRGRKPAPRARFVINERASSPDTERLVTQFGHDSREKWNMRH